MVMQYLGSRVWHVSAGSLGMLDEFFCAFARATDCAREAAEHQLFVSLQTACGAAWLSSVELVLFPSFESCNFSLFTWDSIRTERVSHISLTDDIEAANHHSTPNFLQVFQQMLRKKSGFCPFFLMLTKPSVLFRGRLCALLVRRRRWLRLHQSLWLKRSWRLQWQQRPAPFIEGSPGSLHRNLEHNRRMVDTGVVHGK